MIPSAEIQRLQLVRALVQWACLRILAREALPWMPKPLQCSTLCPECGCRLRGYAAVFTDAITGAKRHAVGVECVGWLPCMPPGCGYQFEAWVAAEGA